jgi:uncharacterized membrane protein
MILVRSFTVLVLHALLATILAATVIGLVELWPTGEPLGTLPAADARQRSARVVGVEETRCRAPGAEGCVVVSAQITSGPSAGEVARFVLGETRDSARLGVGDRIRVVETGLPPGAEIGGVEAPRYAFSDFERERPLLVLVLLFAVLVVALSRLQGLLSLVGLALSLALVVVFVVPAILEGASPVAVALVGALAVMFVTIPLCHGLGPKSVAAGLGTAAALALIVGLAELFSRSAHLTGLASEEAVFVSVSGADVSLRGLLVAGMVIGALGVLDDLTVSQSSTVLALRAANPALDGRSLFRRALGVGRDHVSATVNTLVLAYVGAALPVLLVFSLSGQSFRGAVGSEVVAAEVVAMLVGSIGLVLAVPLTTAIAALLASRLRGDELASVDADAHQH